ncbi:hypothetical protein Tsubulata_002429 [Turnera subulata]|uniref:CCHC-type domain-containing protein n=1 Tax=Turnera subulata TaxID=218843 RepID=A0A9Q0GLL7_9ROSI|nr:hypothetical protein Tsubulata_002429 [Turnera subulata]
MADQERDVNGEEGETTFNYSHMPILSLDSDDEAPKASRPVLVGKIISDYRRFSSRTVSEALARAWNLAKSTEVTEVKDNMFTFVFESENDKARVLLGSPWSVSGCHICLKEWPESCVFDSLSFNELEFWVQVYGLPPQQMRRSKALKMANLLAGLLEIELPRDNSPKWGVFFRMGVKIDVRQPIPAGFITKSCPEDLAVDIRFRYEELGDFCYYCGQLGHVEKDCGLCFNDRKMSRQGRHPANYCAKLRAPKSYPRKTLSKMKAMNEDQMQTEAKGLGGTQPNTVAREIMPPKPHYSNSEETKEQVTAATGSSTTVACPVVAEVDPQASHVRPTLQANSAYKGKAKALSEGRTTTRSGKSPHQQDSSAAKSIYKRKAQTDPEPSKKLKTQAALRQTGRVDSNLLSTEPPFKGRNVGPNNIPMTAPLAEQNASEAAVSPSRLKVFKKQASEGLPPSDLGLIFQALPFLWSLWKYRLRRYLKTPVPQLIPKPLLSLNRIWRWWLANSHKVPNELHLMELSGFGAHLDSQRLTKVQVTAITKNFFDTIIEGGLRDEVWHATFVYGEPACINRRQVLEELARLRSKDEEPWICMGDFNAMTDDTDKEGGKEFCLTLNQRFRDWIDTCGLIDLGFNGFCYTWNNKRKGAANVRERIDRCLANASWRILFDKAQVFHKSMTGSNHRPLRLHLSLASRRIRRNFRFEAKWVEEEECQQVIRDAWSKRACGSRSYVLIEKLRRSRKYLSRWKQARISNARAEIEGLIKDLDVIYEQIPTDESIQREHTLLSRLEVLWRQEEKYWHQQDRIKWLSAGDKNTKFFHLTTIQRRNQNKILALQEEAGAWVEDEVAVENLVSLLVFAPQYGHQYAKEAVPEKGNVEDRGESSKGTMMHATATKMQVEHFSSKLQEGKAYRFGKFRVLMETSQYRPDRHEMKLQFLAFTKVEGIDCSIDRIYVPIC